MLAVDEVEATSRIRIGGGMLSLVLKDAPRPPHCLPPNPPCQLPVGSLLQ